jgi:hypothetical protein
MPAGPSSVSLYRYTSRATCSVLQGLPDPSKPHCYALLEAPVCDGDANPVDKMPWVGCSHPMSSWPRKLRALVRNAFKDRVALAFRAPSKSTGNLSKKQVYWLADTGIVVRASRRSLLA